MKLREPAWKMFWDNHGKLIDFDSITSSFRQKPESGGLGHPSGFRLSPMGVNLRTYAKVLIGYDTSKAPARHSRAGGNPVAAHSLDSHLRGNNEVIPRKSLVSLTGFLSNVVFLELCLVFSAQPPGTRHSRLL
jgi:hypothetical protein